MRPRSCLVFCLLLVLFRGSDYARAQAADSSSNAAAGLEGNNFFARLAQAYKNDWTGKTPAQPSPTRIPPAPLDSPPFPNAYWNYGGASVIGATNTTDYPLMEAIYSGSSGEAWKRSGVQIYGWINPGFNFSTSSRSLLPLGYNF